MKKKIVLAAVIVFSLLVTNKVSAQESTKFDDVTGVNLLNAGVGLGTYGLYGTGGLPLTASFEHGFSKNISAGLEAGLVQRKYGYGWKYSYFIIGARGSYHFNEVLNVSNPKLDVYGGAGLLYRHFKIKYTGEWDELYGKASSGDVTLDLHAGGRYMFSDNVGGFAEVGYGFSPLKLGVSLKF
ncbi:MAG: hypothetical protein J7502_12395 [Flavisolibacter sp.]|nr:hypothetical protein [Flavisolibacter sp.]